MPLQVAQERSWQARPYCVLFQILGWTPNTGTPNSIDQIHIKATSPWFPQASLLVAVYLLPPGIRSHLAGIFDSFMFPFVWVLTGYKPGFGLLGPVSTGTKAICLHFHLLDSPAQPPPTFRLQVPIQQILRLSSTQIPGRPVWPVLHLSLSCLRQGLPSCSQSYWAVSSLFLRLAPDRQTCLLARPKSSWFSNKVQTKAKLLSARTDLLNK